MSYREALRKATCEASRIYGVSIDEIKMPHHLRNATPLTCAKRYVAFYMHWHTGMSNAQIAEELAVSDTATIIHWINRECELKMKLQNPHTYL